MKKLLIVPLLATSMLLGSCSSLFGPNASQTIVTWVSDVQAAAAKACQYIPEALQIAAVVAAAVPGLSSVGAMASAFCQAASAGTVVGSIPGAGPGTISMSTTGQPTIGGVVISGGYHIGK